MNFLALEATAIISPSAANCLVLKGLLSSGNLRLYNPAYLLSECRFQSRLDVVIIGALLHSVVSAIPEDNRVFILLETSKEAKRASGIETNIIRSESMNAI